MYWISVYVCTVLIVQLLYSTDNNHSENLSTPDPPKQLIKDPVPHGHTDHKLSIFTCICP